MDINSSQNHNFDQARNALDLNGLNAIREQSRATDGEAKKEALKEAAQQFEAIFMRMLLSSMRKAQDVLESDSPFNSESTKFYRDMHDQQMAVELSSNGSLGLTDLIVRQLGGDSGDFKPSSVLRNDGNLTVTSNADDKSNNKNKANTNKQHNSLVEKMLGHKNQIKPDIDIPFAGNYQAQSITSAQASSAASQFTLRELDKKSNKDVSQSQSVNSSALVSEHNFNEPKGFVSALIAPAQKVQQTLGVPFEVVIAQAALETGWGQKIIKGQDGTSSNNLFNIKADSRWSGDKVTKETLEFEQGAMVKKAEPFRMYQSITDSVNDYINFLSTSERYQDALQDSGNVEHFLQGLQKAGYATDPQYADKILGTLKTVTNLLAK
ncbi:flagellar assembly peptidoglycan hydrolase FlgJ [Colwellia psychrerythraea]|uniref:Peptidoglycan hydrolase FlgJ n=1 Tax=Colwellia psychrerythraea TaxID=28229 RepID=A0A099L205_COLPS|nr:flagellar assembly peptidoglycan hydrolase FlgJ [Colwellia psychrerythraea]KGJ96994.1 flagellar rod assembly protein/muramidase FlgJ [Colwellia psychrerythraea]